MSFQKTDLERSIYEAHSPEGRACTIDEPGWHDGATEKILLWDQGLHGESHYSVFTQTPLEDLQGRGKRQNQDDYTSASTIQSILNQTHIDSAFIYL